MVRRIFFVVLILCLSIPAFAEQVSITHPSLNEPAKGLYVDGKAYVPIDVVNQIYPGTFVWDQERKVIASPNQEARKPILFVGEEDSLVLTALKADHLPVQQSRRLPAQFGDYSAIVVADEKACTPERSEQMERYLTKGGGLVFIGKGPQGFRPGGYGVSLGDTSKWFGAGVFTGHNTERAYANAAIGHPFGTAIKKSDVLWSGAGGSFCPSVPEESVGGATQPVLYIKTEAAHPSFGGPGASGSPAVFAFAHPYGPGRVYWQCMVPPDFPRLTTIFIGGVKWAAGIVDKV